MTDGARSDAPGMDVRRHSVARKTQPGHRPRGRVLAVAVGVAVVASLTSGCAYTGSTLLPAHIKTVAIPAVGNDTDRYGLEQQLTASLLEAYTRDGHLRVVSGGSADAELAAKVTRYRNDVFSYTSSEQPNEYQVSIAVSVVFTDRVKNRELWKSDGVTAVRRYKLTDSLGVAQQNAQPAADAAVVRQISDDIVARTVQGW